ncbi:hypothetical protein BT96DRAFT_611258 [Gymnopus androsaceus JB14]|uniref:Uncharacterized protein n=1 Tax=Gymnopus androsaceus JB14 TaxID=1447944 RepID=A0A6A4HTT0_9AGAR|nr:hypothetical protein BT96DRAFT_611258 [Gymnopus androsaceus JB14]
MYRRRSATSRLTIQPSQCQPEWSDAMQHMQGGGIPIKADWWKKILGAFSLGLGFLFRSRKLKVKNGVSRLSKTSKAEVKTLPESSHLSSQSNRSTNKCSRQIQPFLILNSPWPTPQYSIPCLLSKRRSSEIIREKSLYSDFVLNSAFVSYFLCPESF